jgi:hypothetical protein
MKKIKSIAALRKWNQEKPILLEWFLPKFEQLIRGKQFKRAKEYRDQFIIFTMKCEFMTDIKAIGRVNSTLEYWADRSNYKTEYNAFTKYINTIGN